jgi:hypothetical protein
MHLKNNSLSYHFRAKLGKTMNSRLVLFLKKIQNDAVLG